MEASHNSLSGTLPNIAMGRDLLNVHPRTPPLPTPHMYMYLCRSCGHGPVGSDACKLVVCSRLHPVLAPCSCQLLCERG